MFKSTRRINWLTDKGQKRIYALARLYVRFGTDRRWYTRFPPEPGGAPMPWTSRPVDPLGTWDVWEKLHKIAGLSKQGAMVAGGMLIESPEQPPFVD